MPKTFEHFAGRRRTDVYEDVSAYMQWGETFRGAFPDLPQGGAYYHFPEDYKLGYWGPSKTRWKSGHWESFRDPDKLTYRTYIERQSQSEQALESVFDASRATDSLRHIDPEWVNALRGFLPSMRFAEWGVSMAHQYVGRFAISGLIANCAVLQSFDELRHTQRIAEISRELDRVHGGFGGYRETWMSDPMFQPLREMLERICVCQDWGEVIVATNLVLEPLLQPVFLGALQELGAEHRDTVLPHLAYSLSLDEQRHVTWANALAKMLTSEGDENVAVTREWFERWIRHAGAAVTPFERVFESVGRRELFAAAYEDALARVKATFAEIGVAEPVAAQSGRPA
jgi:toluene monooxygenase system protein E